MPEKLPKSEVGRLADHLVRGLIDLTGESLILYACDSPDVYVIADILEEDRLVYDVCDGLPRTRQEALTYEDLPLAMAEARKIVNLGSWGTY